MKKLRPLIVEIERRPCGGNKSKKKLYFSLTDSTEDYIKYAAEPISAVPYNRTHIIRDIILPLLRYSNAPKVRGCRVQFNETASMANQSRAGRVSDHISVTLSRHSHVTAKVYESQAHPSSNRLDDSQRTNTGIQNGIYTVCLISSLLLSTAR